MHPPRGSPGDFTEFPLSAGAQLIAPSEAPPPATEPSACAAQASLRPGDPSLGGTLGDIRARGTVVVAVDQNTNLFSFRDPTTGTLTGFGVDLAREVARDLLGDPTRVEFRPLGTDDGAEMLARRDADMVVRPVALPVRVPRTWRSPRCISRHPAGSWCGTGRVSPVLPTLPGDGSARTTTPRRCRRCRVSPPKATILAVPDWDDCLMAIQQRQVDAVAGAAVLAGLVAQDPNLEIVGPETDSARYAIGLAPGHDDLVRFVNGTLERLRTDGTWTALYDRWLSSLGPAPGPPSPQYRD